MKLKTKLLSAISLIMLCGLALACGDGGGETTVNDDTPTGSFYADDSFNIVGTWYAVSSVVDGEEQMPVEIRQHKLVFNSERAVVSTLEYLGADGVYMTGSTISSSGDGGVSITTDNVVIGTGRKLSISYETVVNGIVMDVSSVFVRAGVPDDYVGMYDINYVYVDGKNIIDSYEYLTMEVASDGKNIIRYKTIGGSIGIYSEVMHVGEGKLYIKSLNKWNVGNIALTGTLLEYNFVVHGNGKSVRVLYSFVKR